MEMKKKYKSTQSEHNIDHEEAMNLITPLETIRGPE